MNIFILLMHRLEKAFYFFKSCSNNEGILFFSSTFTSEYRFITIKIQMGNTQNFQGHNEEVPNSKEEGFTPIYRKKGLKQFIQTPEESIKTVKDMLKVVKARFADVNGLGQIIVTNEQGQNGQEVQKRTIKIHTYPQVYETSFNLGRFLFARSLFFVEELHKMKLIGIYSKNRYEWFITDWACAHFGLVSVPLYDTLGVENMSYCLNQTLMTTLFVGSVTVKSLLKLENLGNLKNIISYDKLDEETQAEIKKRGLTLYDYSDIISQGSKLTQVNNEDIIINPNDCYTFSYTSGTTGPPKGAMLSHKNMLAQVATFMNHQELKVNNQHRYLSYLPLPHSMERCISLAMIYKGSLVVASSGNTLKLKEDCQAVKITFFIAVPRIYNRIVQGVKNKFAAETGIKKWLIDTGVSSKLANAKQNGQFSHTLYDSLIFSKVREGFGGCVRMMATGSAPLSKQAHAYMKAIMCCPLIEGYGQTQNSGGAIFNRAYDSTYGTLTEICTGVEVRLSDIPEMKYTSKDVNQQGELTPRGEVWMRGPQVFLGYYKQPQITKQTITQDGWLKTGDIAELNVKIKGFKIIDRKKNIFKLQQGEYLAPDRIESFYAKCDLVSESFLHGDSHQYFAVAVVTPNRQKLEKLAESKNIKGTFEEICANPEIRKMVLTEMNGVGKREGLNGYELAKNIHLEPNGFLSKGILTNTMKLVRYDARKVYKTQIENMYKEGELPLK